MRKPFRGYGIASRQIAAEIKADQRKVSDSVRNARGIVMKLFDLKRQKTDADDRVSKAREKLESVDVFGLRQELETAIKAQALIDADIAVAEQQLAEMQGENVLMAG
jgi:hypothetical protein